MKNIELDIQIYFQTTATFSQIFEEYEHLREPLYVYSILIIAIEPKNHLKFFADFTRLQN